VPCAACGTENRAASRFCDNCGAPLEANCPACGEPNRSDARFCASCGATLAAGAPAAAATQPATAERRLVSVLFTDAWLAHSEAAVAALDGRPEEAAAAFSDAITRLRSLGQMFAAAATGAIDAAVVLPGDPKVRALAEEARPLLVELRARPYLDKLDEALAASPSVERASSVEARSEAPTGG